MNWTRNRSDRRSAGHDWSIRFQADCAVAAVELDLHRRPEGIVVLDVVALARPLRHGLAQLAPAPCPGRPPRAGPST